MDAHLSDKTGHPPWSCILITLDFCRDLSRFRLHLNAMTSNTKKRCVSFNG